MAAVQLRCSVSCPKSHFQHSFTHSLTNIYEQLLCASGVRPKIKVQGSANSLWSTQECLEWSDSKCLSPPCS